MKNSTIMKGEQVQYIAYSPPLFPKETEIKNINTQKGNYTQYNDICSCFPCPNYKSDSAEDNRQIFFYIFHVPNDSNTS